ncbi:autotransporter outer membrane beta-barrel domain-containing protein [Granulosicoccus antarcticus]|uniref:Autotransporter domain-containing protein n=1 Tax=Granulosicoccus antarcticus IMCC3135 TaxID=1192854 RepID=A0A2Z2NSN5_9GAMM|nr:autotransporter outer membrane beta-barrel domain-containing protein [Granulosicoccus antarcticus]ASJ74273.1 hypothetical protein IMCC3135_20980 [Granulosicoccus antarcticus IMCC3135]
MIRVEYSRDLHLAPGIIKTGSIFCLFVTTLGGGLVYAQDFEPSTSLGRTDGFTELQQRTGDAIQTVCGAFINASQDPDGGIDNSRNDVAQQQVLFDKCGEMVHTANVLAGAEPGSAGTAKDLGITADELGAAVQNAAAEEVAAAGSLATESVARQSSTVGRRLSSLLSRVSSLQLSSANMTGAGGMIAAGSLATDSLVGGAAAADDALASPFGFYVNGLGARSDKDATEGEDGFEASSTGLSLGFDYLITPTIVGGVNLGYTSSTTDFDTTLDVDGGDLESEQINISGYGMWFSDSAYVDVIAGFSSGSFDMTRRIVINGAEGATDNSQPDNPQANDGVNDTVRAETDSSAFRFGVGGGYEFRSGGLSFAPYGRISLLSVDLDAYQETGDSALKLSVNKQSIESLTGAVGFRLSKTFSTSKAIISPQLSVELIHEFDDDSRQIVSTYVHDPRNTQLIVVTDSPDRNYYTIGAGASAVLQGGTQLYTEIRSLQSLEDLKELSIAAGIRFEFM